MDLDELQPAKPRRTRWRSRRGVFLICYGILFTLVGVGILISPPPNGRFRGLGEFSTFMDSAWWCLLWIVPALTGFFYGLIKMFRVTAKDQIGFACIVLPPTIWTVLYVITGAAHTLTSGAFGDSRGWIGALTYTLILVPIYVVSSWSDEVDWTAAAELRGRIPREPDE